MNEAKSRSPSRDLNSKTVTKNSNGSSRASSHSYSHSTENRHRDSTHSKNNDRNLENRRRYDNSIDFKSDNFPDFKNSNSFQNYSLQNRNNTGGSHSNSKNTNSHYNYKNDRKRKYYWDKKRNNESREPHLKLSKNENQSKYNESRSTNPKDSANETNKSNKNNYENQSKYNNKINEKSTSQYSSPLNKNNNRNNDKKHNKHYNNKFKYKSKNSNENSNKSLNNKQISTEKSSENNNNNNKNNSYLNNNNKNNSNNNTTNRNNNNSNSKNIKRNNNNNINNISNNNSNSSNNNKTKNNIDNSCSNGDKINNKNNNNINNCNSSNNENNKSNNSNNNINNNNNNNNENNLQINENPISDNNITSNKECNSIDINKDQSESKKLHEKNLKLKKDLKDLNITKFKNIHNNTKPKLVIRKAKFTNENTNQLSSLSQELEKTALQEDKTKDLIENYFEKSDSPTVAFDKEKGITELEPVIPDTCQESRLTVQPKISLVPLNNLLKENILLEINSKDLLPDNILDSARQDITEILVNKVARMDKIGIKNIINNPATKFDEALKQKARQHLRDEIRKELRAIHYEHQNSDGHYQSIDSFESDDFYNHEAISEAVLEQIRRTFGIDFLADGNTSESQSISTNISADLNSINSIFQSNYNNNNNNNKVLADSTSNLNSNDVYIPFITPNNQDDSNSIENLPPPFIISDKLIKTSPTSKLKSETTSPRSFVQKTAKIANEIIPKELTATHINKISEIDLLRSPRSLHEKLKILADRQIANRANNMKTPKKDEQTTKFKISSSPSSSSSSSNKNKIDLNENEILIIDSSSSSSNDSSSSSSDSSSDSDTSSSSSSSDDRKNKKLLKKKYKKRNHSLQADVINRFRRLVLPNLSKYLQKKFDEKYSKTISSSISFIYDICLSKIFKHSSLTQRAKKVLKTKIKSLKKNEILQFLFDNMKDLFLLSTQDLRSNEICSSSSRFIQNLSSSTINKNNIELNMQLKPISDTSLSDNINKNDNNNSNTDSNNQNKNNNSDKEDNNDKDINDKNLNDTNVSKVSPKTTTDSNKPKIQFDEKSLYLIANELKKFAEQQKHFLEHKRTNSQSSSSKDSIISSSSNPDESSKINSKILKEINVTETETETATVANNDEEVTNESDNRISSSSIKNNPIAQYQTSNNIDKNDMIPTVNDYDKEKGDNTVDGVKETNQINENNNENDKNVKLNLITSNRNEIEKEISHEISVNSAENVQTDYNSIKNVNSNSNKKSLKTSDNEIEQDEVNENSTKVKSKLEFTIQKEEIIDENNTNDNVESSTNNELNKESKDLFLTEKSSKKNENISDDVNSNPANETDNENESNEPANSSQLLTNFNSPNKNLQSDENKSLELEEENIEIIEDIKPCPDEIDDMKVNSEYKSMRQQIDSQTFPNRSYESLHIAALMQQNKIEEHVVTNLKEIDIKLLDLHKRKMFVEEMILKLQKDKMEIDFASMQLQNEKFIIINTAVSKNNLCSIQNQQKNSLITFQAYMNSSKTMLNEPLSASDYISNMFSVNNQNLTTSIPVASASKRKRPSSHSSSSKSNSSFTKKLRSCNKHCPASDDDTNDKDNVADNVKNNNSESVQNKNNKIDKPPLRSILKKSIEKSEKQKPSKTSSSSIKKKKNENEKISERKPSNDSNGSDECDTNEDPEMMKELLKESKTCRNGEFIGSKLAITQIKICDKYLIASSQDGNIYKFCWKTKKLLGKFSKHTESVTQIYIDRNNCIYSISLDGFLRKTSIEQFGLEMHSVNLEEPLQSIDVAWNTVYVGSKWGNVFSYKLLENKISDTFKYTTKSTITALKATKLNKPKILKILIIASKNDEIQIINAVTCHSIRTLESSKTQNLTSIFLKEHILYCGSNSNHLSSFNIKTGSKISTISCGESIFFIKIIKQNLLFIGCIDGSIYISTKNDGKVIYHYKLSDNQITALNIFGEKIIFATKNNKMEMTDMPSFVLSYKD